MLWRHRPQLFRNKEIDSLYFTESLMSFGVGLISVFVPLYFWRLGLPLWQILFFYFEHAFSFVVLALILLPLLRRLSDKMMMFLGLPFLFLYCLGLGRIAEWSNLFYVLPWVASLYGVFFNVGYHIDFSCSADGDCLGKEVGGRFLVSALVTFSAPALGGLLISWLGFQNTFWVSAVILLVAIMPLFLFPRRTVAKTLSYRAVFKSLTDRRLEPFNWSIIGYAVETRLSEAVWPLVVFLSISSLRQFGSLVSIGLLLGALTTHFVGYLSDHGERRSALSISALIYSAVWVLRALMRQTWAIVGLHIGANVVGSALQVAWGSQFVKLARLVENSAAFILSRELIYNLTRVIIFPPLILLAVILPLEMFFRVSLLVAAVASLGYLLANKTHSSAFTSKINV